MALNAEDPQDATISTLTHPVEAVMKRSLLAAILGIALFMGILVAQTSPAGPASQTQPAATGAAEPPKAVRTSMKGWELYTWSVAAAAQKADGTAPASAPATVAAPKIMGRLLEGTNREKTDAEIAAGAVEGLPAVEGLLDELKAGESVRVMGRNRSAVRDAGAAKAILDHAKKLGLSAS
jgi:hypothetical protein